MKTRFVIFILAGCFFAAALLLSCNSDKKKVGPLPNTDWPLYGGNNAGNRYSDLEQINLTNVKTLKLAWTYHANDIDTGAAGKNRQGREIQCQPIVIKGILYGTNATLKLFAIEAATGKELWKFDPFRDTVPRYHPNRGVMYWENGNDKRIIYSAGSSLLAIDAGTGKPVTSFGVQGKVDLHEGLSVNFDASRLSVSATTPGVIYKNTVVMGSSVSEGGDAAPGYVRGFDVVTGKLKWVFHTIPLPGEAGYDKGMELGADDYIAKPFSGTELLNAVDSRLKKIDLLKQEMFSGMEGVQHLITASPGKNILQAFTKDRNSNAYKKKQTIYSEGNHPNGLFFVLSGKVKTYKTNDNGKELVTDLFNTGDFLGYIALLRDAVYRDTAEALEETELAVIPKNDFVELIHNNGAIAQKFIRMLARNVAEKEDQLLGLAYNSLRKKVADAILLLQKKYSNNNKETFQIDISRENLATIAGTATESLIRTLSDFRSEKLIELKEGVITIFNQQKLENLPN